MSRKNNPYKLKCLECNKDFKGLNSKIKFCSDECRIKNFDSDNPQVRAKIIAESYDVHGHLKKGAQLYKLKRTHKSDMQFKEAMKRLFRESVGEEDIVVIIKKMIQQAKNGNNVAQKELLDRVLGKVKESIDVKVSKIEWEYNIDYEEQNKEE